MIQEIFASIFNWITQLIQSILALDPMKFALLAGTIVFLVIFRTAHKSGKLDWTDMITSKGTNKVALTKFLQLVGGITATWIMVYETMKGELATELFLIYLCYVGAIEGWSKFVAARYGLNAGNSMQTTTSQTAKSPPMGPKVP